MGLFEKYLDGCDDAPTLELEIGQLEDFLSMLDCCEYADEVNKEIFAKSNKLFSPFDQLFDYKTTNVQKLFRLIRDVWDVAYSHGEHDALIGEGVSLAEIISEEE